MPSEPAPRRLEDRWYSDSPPALWLRGAALLFGSLAALRRGLYKRGVLAQQRAGATVIVVGNLTAGGTGKTPLVLWLHDWLTRRGYRPGVVSRGYGGRRSRRPREVGADTDPAVAGDEAVLLARRGANPVAICVDRVAAARFLVDERGCNCILSDDGLQHYRLYRHLDIAVVDGTRRFGNRRLLPAGPLREPVSRLRAVDLVVNNGGHAEGEYTMQLQADRAVPLRDSAGVPRTLAAFKNETVHAVAGIGNPGRFFDMLRDAGLDVIAHPFPDHHVFQPGELRFDDEHPVLMTEKDAVKCTGFHNPKLWYVPVEARLEPGFEDALDRRLARSSA